MTRIPYLQVAIILLAALVGTNAAAGGELRIVHSIDLPGESGFGRGLAWDGEYLWAIVHYNSLGLWVPYMYGLDPSSGEIVDQFMFGGFSPGMARGAAWDGESIEFWDQMMIAGICGVKIYF